jgi:hypothetical protein
LLHTAVAIGRLGSALTRVRTPVSMLQYLGQE